MAKMGVKIDKAVSPPTTTAVLTVRQIHRLTLISPPTQAHAPKLRQICPARHSR
ncbi:hypothetical protein [Moraxella lacunata]|uniref:hypothetical protein n=1 Tax=Moraxella lacunata TaxID=477 RepID=UPI003EE39BC6